MDSAQLDSPQPGNYDGLMKKSNIGSCKKIGEYEIDTKINNEDEFN